MSKIKCTKVNKKEYVANEKKFGKLGPPSGNEKKNVLKILSYLFTAVGCKNIRGRVGAPSKKYIN